MTAPVQGRFAAEPLRGRLGEPARRAAPVATDAPARRARASAPGVTRRGVLGAMAALAALPAGAADPLRLALLHYGTVAWEIEAIRAAGLDAAEGVALAVRPMAGDAAARIAFQGGEADTMVADFLWVARQRAEGRDYVLLPYSRNVGAILVPPGSPRASLGDLDGARIGIAGGPLDKNWLILRALGLARGIDLAAVTEPVFAAPPLLSEQAVSGGIDAILTYWHYGARLQARGFRPLVTVAEAAAALGLDPATPLLGYVFDGAFVARAGAQVAAFSRASRAAKALLQGDAAWEGLRPLMKAADEGEFVALRDGFRAGIPAPGPVDAAAAARLFAVLRDLGGAELVGAATDLPPGLFLDL